VATTAPFQFRGRAPTSAATIAGFDLATALDHAGGDRDLLDELLTIFAEDAPVQMDSIQRAVDSGDASELMRAAHTLQGSLKVFGAMTAASVAQDLEAGS